jgi:hypothetical protein
MPKIKVQPHAGDTLCARCHDGYVAERANGLRVAICHVTASPVRMPLDVVRCTDFTPRDTPTRWEMEKVAWTLNTDKSGKVIGFRPPKKDD